ncbi:hypothetical protein FB451DRAFT_1507089 [Mycena latifolia]|nr:hypothetical protein FB451DRAFT_1507089 [Mycena latifolia]
MRAAEGSLQRASSIFIRKSLVGGNALDIFDECYEISLPLQFPPLFITEGCMEVQLHVCQDKLHEEEVDGNEARGLRRFKRTSIHTLVSTIGCVRRYCVLKSLAATGWGVEVGSSQEYSFNFPRRHLQIRLRRPRRCSELGVRKPARDPNILGLYTLFLFGQAPESSWVTNIFWHSVTRSPTYALEDGVLNRMAITPDLERVTISYMSRSWQVANVIQLFGIDFGERELLMYAWGYQQICRGSFPKGQRRGRSEDPVAMAGWIKADAASASVEYHHRTQIRCCSQT